MNSVQVHPLQPNTDSLTSIVPAASASPAAGSAATVGATAAAVIPSAAAKKPTAKLEEDRFVHFSDAELLERELIVNDNLIYWGPGIIKRKLETGVKRINWALHQDGKIFADYVSPATGIFHTALHGKRPIKVSGEMLAKDGIIVHIAPRAEFFQQNQKQNEQIKLMNIMTGWLKELGYTRHIPIVPAMPGTYVATPPRRIRSIKPGTSSKAASVHPAPSEATAQPQQTAAPAPAPTAAAPAPTAAAPAPITAPAPVPTAAPAPAPTVPPRPATPGVRQSQRPPQDECCVIL